ncbi:DUF134 domain-containing protein [Patescibacteria group bacterium]|nr:DUF134 domain-containing protein [Patescibacteria group bacterium]
MPRPRKHRFIRFSPQAKYFKPRGIPLQQLETIEINPDEMEAIRLCDLEELNMEQAARKMKISKSTIHRVLSDARQKIAEGLIKSKALKIND